ncbi:hypothetical protein CBM2615_A120108 [Cupriavidus taiwanensis]|uniref:Uncharacterized protein n=1 Tax=Cupriavidus taiwanensis TaxID=164546 RepID=A0A375DZ62_9BURK|nr:hypothetical protein CBM2615_A120108 [Cupriavidus taiwanensis]SOZ49281.1 hypothetical protein CBM2614_A120106 [Cupriavidus taiwanensis]SOZ51915.1 hypothetical protein CBM2613_A110107 [Cupriavidus taiwanensis]SPA07116.1 hypothetical protein CBM2625_A90105 [Cupriavidus taiwanensis]
MTEQEGDKVGLGVSGPVASTTDTSAQDRQTSDIAALDDRGYRCEQTNSDTHITYRMLDAWAKFPDFQTRIRDAILRRQALDRIMIGFNGLSRAATSNRAAKACELAEAHQRRHFLKPWRERLAMLLQLPLHEVGALAAFPSSRSWSGAELEAAMGLTRDIAGSK